MMSESSSLPRYVNTLNPIQRQMLAELDVDFLWGDSLAPNLQLSAVKRESNETISSSSTTAISQSHAETPAATTISSVERKESITSATQEAANAHAEEARKMLQRARHRLPVAQQHVTSEPQQTAVVVSEEVQSHKELSQMSWQELKVYAENCSACELKEHRERTVFANQSEERQCDWLFLEQVPSEHDEDQGEPMSSEAGVLFDQMLFALGLSRTDVAVLPLIKCRPDLSIGFNSDWMSACSPILLEQIKRLKPKCIVAFGDAAASLLQKEMGILALRRQELFFEHPEIGQIPVIATFSPHYLLRNSSVKAQTWQDLKRARQIIRGHI